VNAGPQYSQPACGRQCFAAEAAPTDSIPAAAVDLDL
jgi:hypothetical protein